MGMQIAGRIHKIKDTKQVTERFRVREFVLALREDSDYPQLVLFQLIGNRCDKLNDFRVNDQVSVEFDVRGREWTSPKGEVRYFNSLDVWEIQSEGAQAFPADEMPFGDPPPPSDDEMPF